MINRICKEGKQAKKIIQNENVCFHWESSGIEPATVCFPTGHDRLVTGTVCLAAF